MKSALPGTREFSKGPFKARQPVLRPVETHQAHRRSPRTFSWHRSAWVGLAAYVAVAPSLAACHCSPSRQGSMHPRPGTSENGAVAPALPDSTAAFSTMHVIDMDSTISRKATNLIGISGLKARVRFNPEPVRIEVRGPNPGQTGIQGNEVTIATVSAGGQLSLEGIAFEHLEPRHPGKDSWWRWNEDGQV